jgi:hypothetical protein
LGPPAEITIINRIDAATAAVASHAVSRTALVGRSVILFP